MLASHRDMSELDIMQLNKMRKVGISTPQIYGSLADHPGGYERLSFCKKDIYNQIGRQRRLQGLDSKCSLEFLNGLKCNDPLMYVGHTVDEENRLQHLFWCDGMMQMEYEVFGDVLAFDATYGKNKYLCPVVVFSGVNHHNHTIVFGSLRMLSFLTHSMRPRKSSTNLVLIIPRYQHAQRIVCSIGVTRMRA
uniref:Protein FAR1-RELATED SEQUENCE 5 n=1 Tax=Cajanus cajan TaxID=3821 RepID=A0A151UDW5_CAJCA